MEVAGVVYETVETLAQGAVALAKGLTQSTAPLKATFKRLKAPSIPRSSHSLCVVKGRAYLFGGEIEPRKPVDNAMHVIVLPPTDLLEADYQKIEAKSSTPDGPVPEARVGHTATVIGQNIYLFGGRGGPNMGALHENGRIWVFDTTTNTWSFLDPHPATAESSSTYPEARSYHASTSTIHPLPKPHRGSTFGSQTFDELDKPREEPKEDAAASNTYGTIFIHAGCLSSGARTSDLWSFDIASQTWSPLPSAPVPDRGGTSIAIVRDRLYRFGGFDGNTEQGGQIDYLDLNTDSIFDDKAGEGIMAISPRGEWQSNIFSPSSDKDGKGGNKTCPANRSVAGFVPVTTGQGREYLLMIGGEGEPSDKGHEGAGRFFDDVWSFQLKPEGGTAASFKDATRGYVMKKGTGETECVEVNYLAGEGTQGDVDGQSGVGGLGESEGAGVSLGEGGGRMIQEGQRKPMSARGWFACSQCSDAGTGGSVLVWGGVGADNSRLGDGWLITVDV